MIIRTLVCAGMAACRLVELSFSQRNIRRGGDSIEGTWSRRTYPAIVALHASVITGTLLWGRAAKPRWLALLIAAQPVRAWALLSLGRKWNARGAVPTDAEIVTGGPYALVRHPNYAVVAVELAALPAAFSLGRLSVAATVLNCLLLSIRIREEEARLFERPDYKAHFRKKPRFLPFLF